MRLDRYRDVDDFLVNAGAFLAAREAEHNLLLGISSRMRDRPNMYGSPPYLALVSDGDRVLMAALRTPPHNLLLSEVDDQAALAPLVDDLEGADLPGVTGPPAAVRAFADAWSAASGSPWETLMEEGVYRLGRVLGPPRPASGDSRLAVAGDRPLIERWLVAFAAEALQEEDASVVLRTADEWAAGARRFWLWEDEGRAVALVGAGGITPNGIRIGPVYTPPELRGRGYASSLTARVSEELLAEGRRFCFLYTNLANGTANRIYQAIGYKRVTDALMVRFVRAAR